MKIVRATTNYTQYLNQFYAQHPHIKSAGYSEHLQALMNDCFGWTDFWGQALKVHGYNVKEIIANAKYLQLLWAKENHVSIDTIKWLEEIALKQIQSISPAVLFIDDHSTFTLEFINYVREQCPSIKLVLGWCGSPIHDHSVFHGYDIVLSNIPELVKEFKKKGHKSYHVNHAFAPKILEKINHPTIKKNDFSFIGSIVKTSNYHIQREILLEKLIRETNLEIWSDVSSSSLLNRRLLPIKQFTYDFFQPWKNNSSLYKILLDLPKLKNFLKLSTRPSLNDFISPSIVSRTHPAVYGISMYQQLANSKITFNNHINISSQSASNMRLFEATGVGTCLVTDWKSNLTELFEPDFEIVTYRNVDECIEKVKWLLENNEVCQGIAKAGQQRTLKDHTFAQRAIQLDKIIRQALSN
ncbi:glycosyltransferase [Synechocystis sp. PCC 7338]|uniref:CgeB family protein n=1 Tax=Synechocystis sp. PCC 7338 TaxID=2732530 RepID=UPI001BAE8A59|nr:glycosyltransferase [Synechocystis sp. PCC 7338]QUS59320.1 glycosyltransferase [Synechocystis sp. PCC 7338]